MILFFFLTKSFFKIENDKIRLSILCIHYTILLPLKYSYLRVIHFYFIFFCNESSNNVIFSLSSVISLFIIKCYIYVISLKGNALKINKIVFFIIVQLVFKLSLLKLHKFISYKFFNVYNFF